MGGARRKATASEWLSRADDEAGSSWDLPRDGGGRLSRGRRSLYVLVVFLTVLALWFLLAAPFEEARISGIDALLRQAGLGWAPLLLWILAFWTALRRGPRRVVRQWNRWLGFLLLAGALGGALSFTTVHLSVFGRERAFNLGGEAIGGAIAGSSSLVGVLRVLVLAVGGAALVLPRRSRQAAMGLIRFIQGAARLGSRAYHSFPLHRIALKGLLMAIGGLRSRRSRPRPFSTQEDALPGEESRRDEETVAPTTEPSPRVMSGEPDQPAHEQSGPPNPSPVIVERPRLPSLDLLRRVPENPVAEEVTRAQARRIEEALAQYGIQVTVEQIRSGPTVTLYGLVPGWIRRQRRGKEQDAERRVTVDAILAREKDLALALAAPSLRFEAPVPGESVVGVEVPNPEPSLVTLRSLMESGEFQKAQESLAIPIALGKGSGGDLVTADLASMPHLLIAGTTGSGKSVCINALLSCLLMMFSPWQMRLLLVDPKRVELTHYNGIPHLVTPVVVEADQAVKVLRGAVLEMTHRLRLLEEQGCRNIQGYNQKMISPLDRMPYLVVVVDELADLMMAAPNDIEYALCRLAQLGRAAGIHLVVATQRPSVDVVTGLIKANFPSRMSFAVASHTDSKTILDATGADKLLGRGDMLFLPQDLPKPKRAQGAFVSDEEMRHLVEFWKVHEGPPPPLLLLEPTADKGEPEEALGIAGRDELLDKARELAQRHSRISTSLLQRRLRIGYPRAARLREELESAGVISPEGEVLHS